LYGLVECIITPNFEPSQPEISELASEISDPKAVSYHTKIYKKQDYRAHNFFEMSIII